MSPVKQKSAIWKMARMFMLALTLGFGFSLTATYASPAYATNQNQQTNQNNCQKFKGLINRFGSCIKETILKVAVKYFDKMYSYFLTTLNAFLTFGVIIYGVMLATGSLVENVKRDTVVLLLKIAFVAFFAANLEMIYFWVIDMMDGLIDLYFQFTTSQDQGKCSDGGEGFGPFKRLDCLLDLVIGIKSGSYQGSYSEKLSGEGVGRGFINFFFKAGISSSLGTLIAGVGFFIVWTLITTVIKITFIYLIAILGLSFTVMIGPLFIPLVIFKATKTYFDSWVKLIVSFGLQPVIMFAYVAMMIIAFDKAVFSGSNSLMSSIAGQAASSGSGFNLNQHMQSSGAIKRDGFGAESKAGDSTKDTAGEKSGTESVIPGTVFRDIQQNNGSSGGGSSGGSSSGSSGGTGANIKTMGMQMPMNMIDWKKMAQAGGKSEKEYMKQLFFSIIFVALVVYVFTTMLNYIPNIGADLTGALGVNLNNIVGQNPLQAAGGNVGNSLQQGVQRLMGGGGQRSGGGR